MLLGPNHAALYRDHCCQVLASFSGCYNNKNKRKNLDQKNFAIIMAPEPGVDLE
jgi:hypothetical protein